MEPTYEISSAAGMLSLIPLLLLIAGLAAAAWFFARKRKPAADLPAPAEKKTGSREQRILILIAAAVLAGLYILGCVLFGYKGFARPQSFLNILRSNAALSCIVCGTTCVMITGGIDFSVGGLVALDCMILAAGMEKAGLSPTVLVPLVLAVGVIFGLIQGYLIGYLGLHPGIVTLMGMYFARGLTSLISMEPVGITTDTWFRALARFKISLPIGGSVNSRGVTVYPYLDVGVLIALAVLILTFLLLRFTRLGRNLYAVGGKKQGALPADVNEKRTKLLAYTLSSLLCSIGGILYCLYTLSATTAIGQGMEIRAVSSAVMGGVLLSGGAGNVPGALIGVLINGTVTNLVNYHPDLGRLGGTLPNLASVALTMVFIVIQAAVTKQPREKQPADAPAEAAAPSPLPEGKDESIQ